VGDWFRICFGLVFLDSEDVSNFFIMELMSIKPINSKLAQFADYILDTYITDEALFPPNIWAQCSAELNVTTNACESFHSHLAQNSHPNIHYFVKALLEIQTFTYIKLNSIDEPNLTGGIHIKKGLKRSQSVQFTCTHVYTIPYSVCLEICTHQLGNDGHEVICVRPIRMQSK